MLTTSNGHPHIPRLLKYINPLRWAMLYLISGCHILEQNKIKKNFYLREQSSGDRRLLLRLCLLQQTVGDVER